MRRSGFTLIEIIVSVTILLVLSGLFIANYNGFNNSQTVRQASLDLISNLQAARTSAAAGVKPSGCDTLVGYIVNFPTGTTYTAQALCLVGAVGEKNTYSLPAGVTFSPIPDPITFYALNGGASADQTISLIGNGVTMDVSVFTSGVVSE
jgi:prepilin-type N-terminal cleavage/methylation domain-containing protein